MHRSMTLAITTTRRWPSSTTLLLHQSRSLTPKSLRFFATNKTQPKETAATSYFETKAATKHERRQRYQQQLAKAEERRHRRDGAPQNVLKTSFRSWWDRHRSQEEKWNRQARQAGQEWKIQVAVVLERLPQILPDVPEWEREYDELYTYLKQFGKEYPKEFQGAPPQVMITDEELLAQLPPNFQPAPRETAADASVDMSTMDRKLQESLYLVVNNNNNNDNDKDDNSSLVVFPTTDVQDDESLLQATQRLLLKKNEKLQVYCPSQAPMGVQLLVPNPTKGDDNYFGTKVFFMRVQHDSGDVGAAVAKQPLWQTRDEIVQHLQEQEGEMVAQFYRYLL